MPGGHFDPDVMHKASSWAEGIKKYKEDKVKPLFDGPTPMPTYVTEYYKKREETTVHPITQKYRDSEAETFVRNLESSTTVKSLNKAWDKQLKYEAQFDVITQQPKLGHIHEVPYVQKLKPPSLVTATMTPYNIVSTLGFDEHHWAPPGKRPDRVPTPVRKPPVLTAVNKPREYDIVSNRYKDFHEERIRFEADQGRSEIVTKFWHGAGHVKGHDFDPIRVAYYDEEKEERYQRDKRDALINGRLNFLDKLPPTLRRSEANMYNITTHEVKDPAALAALRAAEASRAARRADEIVGREAAVRRHDEEGQDLAMQRKLLRVAHQRHEDILARGFDIVTNEDLDLTHQAEPLTKPHIRVPWDALQKLRRADGGDGGGRGGSAPSAGGGAATRKTSESTRDVSGLGSRMTMYDLHGANIVPKASSPAPRQDGYGGPGGPSPALGGSGGGAGSGPAAAAAAGRGATGGSGQGGSRSLAAPGVRIRTAAAPHRN